MIKLKKIGLLFLLSVIGVSPLLGQGFQISKDYSLFADHKARKVGDILTVLIIEFSEADNRNSTSTSKADNISISVDNGTGVLGFLPDFGLGASTSSTFTGDGVTSRRGSLKGKLTATIVEILPNGNYQVEGRRIIELNQDKQEMKLSGIVRPRDIRADNTVYSYLIADANIKYVGKGTINRASQVGLIRRILNWIL